MYFILYRVTVSEISNPYFASCLTDTLDTSFALLKPSRIPRKIDVDERAEALKI